MPEELLTPEMLAAALKLPSHPRPSDVRAITDILPIDFYPNESPLDRAIFAADAAAEKHRAGKKLLAQYNFKLKVVGEQDEQVAKFTKLLADAKKEADRARADAESFRQADGQLPSTSGTQSHFAAARDDSSTSGQRSTPRSDRRDDAPSYRGGKGGKSKSRK